MSKKKIDLAKAALDRLMRLFKLKEPLDVTLMNLLIKGDIEGIEALVKRGADVNHCGFQGQSPLHIAARSRDISLIRILLSNGARINARDDSGETPLFNAASFGHPEIVKLLLEKGADITIRNKYEQNAFYKAFQFFKSGGNAKCADILSEAGSDPNPIHSAPIHSAPTQLLRRVPREKSP